MLTTVLLVSIITFHVTFGCDPQPLNRIKQTLGLTGIEDTFIYVITSSDVRQLCKNSIPTYPSLQMIVLDDNNISYIEAGAFSENEEVAVELQANELREITTGVFNGSKITSLNLKGNKIERIDTEAFDDMEKLETIILDDNKLKIWNEDWFRNTPILGVVIFSSNFIQRLPEAAFKNFQAKSNVSLIFNNNAIEDVHVKALDGIQELAKLNLAGNHLETFPISLFRSVRIRVLDLKETNLNVFRANK